jgi:hypothetical protein
LKGLGGFLRETLRKNTINIFPTRTIFCPKYIPLPFWEVGSEQTTHPGSIAE